ncbi:MAG: hypothetical protein FWE42_04400 [Defluviitaleaceae bacterium]|nr:hypothetical protein [Defluviitaleaceae bacterium]
MNLLSQGLLSGAVVQTNLSRKLTLDGITQAYPVYKVRLDQLYYNDQNDRISTWISEYRSEHGALDVTSREVFNAVIEGFIVKSNPEAIRKTQANIELVDQREPGVVLADGRIIDGNRRYACLRRLAQKNDRFNYFETIILDRNIESSAKQIKMLELSVQHGEESKVDYNPIDRLVGVYNDIIDTKLLSAAEYARSANESAADVNKRIEIAGLLVEFLEFINAPLQFHVARDMQVFSSIEALAILLKKCRTSDEAEDVKISVFTNILMRSEGDMRTYVRSLRRIIGSEYQDGFIEEQKEIAAKVIEMLPEKVNDRVIRDVVRADDEIVRELGSSLDKVLMKVNKTETRNRPLQHIEKATDFLESIDLNIMRKLNESDLMRIERQLKRLDNAVQEIRAELGHGVNG